MSNRCAHLRLAVIALLAVGCGSHFSASPGVFVNDGQIAAAGAVPEVLLLEHRGARYSLDELNDPAYRAQSDDPFVQRFDASALYARRWAGIDRAEREQP